MGISFDVGKAPAVAVVNILLPFLPGGTLVLGILLGFPHRAWLSGDLSTANNLERLALIIFLSYVSGFALVLLVDGLSSPVNVVAAVFARKRLYRSAPWKDPAWRKTACVFLPPGLGPVENGVSHPEKEQGTLIGAPDKPESPNNQVSMQVDARFSDTDQQWKCWYGVISAYLRERIAREMKLTEYFMSTFATLGVVGLLLLRLGVAQGWLFWTGSILMILFGTYYKSLIVCSRVCIDSSRMTAEMLRELNERSAHSAATAPNHE